MMRKPTSNLLTRRTWNSLAAGLAAAPAGLLQGQQALPKLRVAVLGLTHGHASGFFRNFGNRPDVEIAGVSDPDKELLATYGKRFALPAERLFASHAALLDQVKPQVALLFTSTYEHKELVEACAKRKIHVMMEKPLAVSNAHARAMQQAAASSGIHVMVNYETTWYPVNQPIWKLVREEKALGAVRRVVTHYGHQGPKEIGTGPEFFNWLTDPEKNGAGALFDFGCYGANFASWLFDNQRPLHVFAVTATNKPAIYPKVEDEATVVVQYKEAQLIIQPSWNWPYSRKDMAIYGTTGSLVTLNPKDYRLRREGEKVETALTAEPLPAEDADMIGYLRSVIFQGRKPSGLSGLENNLLVTEILVAARESARTGRQVRLA